MFFWVLGTTCIFLLAILLIPLGFTLKGKLIIVFTSLVLALSGMVAAARFSLWLTALMLFALVFFASYFIHQRFGSLLFPEISFESDLYEVNALDELNYQNVNGKEDNSELQQLFSSSNTRKTIDNSLQMTVSDQNIEPELVMNEEDIVFLQDRDLPVEIPNEINHVELNYLSDIESLLEKSGSETHDLIDEKLVDQTTRHLSRIDKNKDMALDPLNEESLFDFLRAHEEAEEEKKEKVSN
ncbi:hypothetical protein [Neobacillus sp. LXY-1]|uniref:hypothetical protein n=1 Tax=Neobacillus sp. LXY-1 TaxID=3379133 RepID=UPI003EE0BE5D